MMMPGLNKYADQWKPDVIINDCITFAGALCAHLKGIPSVTKTPVLPVVMRDTSPSAPRIFYLLPPISIRGFLQLPHPLALF
ncbi:hypothetical protein ACFSOV_12850 [Pedobacter petrophilus]|uniref:hypothetical protein n=1 Tax=Pedobacter petrophilus TaxID=1908241 RepID=UPI0036411659